MLAIFLDWKLHLFLGVVCGAALAHFIFNAQGEGLLLFCAIAGIGALLPDIDLRKSKVSKMAYGACAALILIFSLLLSGGDGAKMLIYASALSLGLLSLDLLARPRHRGIIHGLAFMLILGAGGFLALGLPFASALLAGYFSHLAADGVLKA